VSEAGEREALETTSADTPDAASASQDEAAEDFASKPERKKSDLALRLGTAAVLIPLVVYVIALGGWPYISVVIVFGLIAQFEFYNMIESKGAKPLRLWGIGFGAAVMAVAAFGSEYSATLLMTASLLVMMVAQLRKAQISESLASISGTFFGVFYVAWLISHAILLRNFDDAIRQQFGTSAVASLAITPFTGVYLMIFTLAAVIGCDAGAYFAGRAWGKRPLAPEISPNKSVEGAIGGVLTGIVFACITKAAFDFVWPTMSAAMPWALVGPMALVLTVVGIIGDLVESLLKRDADMKDAGSLLPGMGGVLDRIDAPLLAFPVIYYMLIGWATYRIGGF
jgi:phosphatidate cytidylyltransferase